jgi:hypothetical protein
MTRPYRPYYSQALAANVSPNKLANNAWLAVVG